MLGRGPDARYVFEGEDEHAQPVENLQAGAVPRGDVGHRVGNGGRNIAENEQDQDPVDDARGRLPAAAVLEDLEDALAQTPEALWLGVHRRAPCAIVASSGWPEDQPRPI